MAERAETMRTFGLQHAPSSPPLDLSPRFQKCRQRAATQFTDDEAI